MFATRTAVAFLTIWVGLLFGNQQLLDDFDSGKVSFSLANGSQPALIGFGQASPATVNSGNYLRLVNSNFLDLPTVFYYKIPQPVTKNSTLSFYYKSETNASLSYAYGSSAYLTPYRQVVSHLVSGNVSAWQQAIIPIAPLPNVAAVDYIYFRVDPQAAAGAAPRNVVCLDQVMLVSGGVNGWPAGANQPAANAKVIYDFSKGIASAYHATPITNNIAISITQQGQGDFLELQPLNVNSFSQLLLPFTKSGQPLLVGTSATLSMELKVDQPMLFEVSFLGSDPALPMPNKYSRYVLQINDLRSQVFNLPITSQTQAVWGVALRIPSGQKTSCYLKSIQIVQ